VEGLRTYMYTNCRLHACTMYMPTRACTLQEGWLLHIMIKHRVQDHQAAVTSIAMTRDSELIASGDVDGTIQVCSADSDSDPHMFTFQGQKSSIWCMDFKDQSCIACAGSSGTIHVWTLDDSNATPLHRLPGQAWQGGVCAVKFSPDGTKIASASHDSTVTIWSAASGQQLLVLRGHQGFVLCVSWSSDSTLVASGGSDTTVHVWDALDGRQVMQPLKRHDSAVQYVEINVTTAFLMSASRDAAIIIWDRDGSREAQTAGAHG
jgi:WD40 repeat protein